MAYGEGAHMKKHVLILEDDLHLSKSLEVEFLDRGYDVSCAEKISDIKKTLYDYAVVDLRLCGEFGLDAIQTIKDFSTACRIVILSGYGSITTAVEAVKRGASDYLTKPVSFEVLEKTLQGEKFFIQPEFKTQSLAQVEHEYIDFVLTQNEGNISKTAKDLGLHRQSLQRKLRKYT